MPGRPFWMVVLPMHLELQAPESSSGPRRRKGTVGEWLIPSILLAGAIALSSCVRQAWPPPAPVEDNQSVRLPQLIGRPVIEIGSGTAAYELEGVVLKAIMIAMNDYVHPEAEDPTCWGSPEAHRFRVTRKGDIIFVRVDEDPEACGLQYVIVDSGATYAISTDGRILRRFFDGGPNKLLDVWEHEGGVQEGGSPPIQQDGGVAPSAPEPPDAPPSGSDGGSPDAH